MDRACIRMRLVRALTGKTQEVFGEDMGSDGSSVGRWELGLPPLPEQEKRAADVAGVTLEWADEAIDLAERHRQRQRPGQGVDDLLGEVRRAADGSARELVQRLLSLPLQPALPRREERLQAREQLPRLAKLSPAQRAAVVRLGRDYHAWALCLEAGAASEEASSRSLEEATYLAEVAGEFADLVEGPKGWPEAVRSRAVAYRANVLRCPGKLKEARAVFEEAKRLAKGGIDPYDVLDPGLLLDLEASLCRDERRFRPALKLLDDAAVVGWCPARALIKKGFTLEVMGDYEGSVAALRQAGAKLDREAEPRLWYKQRAQLAATLTQLGQHGDAAALVEEARPVAMEVGDEIDLVRLTWVEGRIQTGLGRRAAARYLLEQAAGQFEAKEMWYDVALARMELAGLHLEEGRTAEVKAVTPALAAAFEAEGVYAEALKALRLFQAAVDQEKATPGLAQRVLAFLFRAQHDPALRFA